MIVTVEEAKTKRCQESFGDGFVAQGATHSVALSGAGSAFCVVASPAFCIGPTCMAWQWAREKTIDGVELGFCGKAGQP